jgi:hypothetical protein
VVVVDGARVVVVEVVVVDGARVVVVDGARVVVVEVVVVDGARVVVVEVVVVEVVVVDGARVVVVEVVVVDGVSKDISCSRVSNSPVPQVTKIDSENIKNFFIKYLYFIIFYINKYVNYQVSKLLPLLLFLPL